MRLFPKQKRAWGIAGRALPIAVFLLMLLFAFRMLDTLDEGAADEQAKLLRAALRKAAVTCYAVEGRYPDSLETLTEQYGVQIDEDRYVVSYDAFASNVPPDIRVYRKGVSLP